MRLDGHRESENVEDARGQGGGGGRFIGGRGIGIGTVAVAVVAGWIFGINPLTILGMLSGGGSPVVEQQAPAGAPPATDPKARFVSMVLADTEDVWRAQFSAIGKTYREPKLRLYTGSEVTACGGGQAAMGPFYCPADEKVYIDLSFYETMRTRLGAPGDFAQAYVIAHEIGHHVQNLLGVSEQVQRARQRSDERTGNQLSVRLELQADCYAGLWAHHAQRSRQILETGDVEEGLNAAAQIGDDAMQRNAGRQVVQERFTHGSSAQRVTWFKRGMEGGKLEGCDTFRAAQ
ncbi:neutral zinc metallopeptidase [Aquincola sp. S2]|uniref:Neutral zinc metallopeptidase n=1 Tax=Pseudaquabacterium terrae TaxID=2732868 RepID=A0ABX2EHB2_9BURK|nr:neutral zinc metallopeptidase [Aquabacterium terrae]NRF68009.1 neutral zinc metallopeptidase [Aquabacterium terrae]